MPYALCPMHVGYLMLLRKAITVIKFVVTASVRGSFIRTKVLTMNQFDCGRVRVHNISSIPAVGTRGRLSLLHKRGIRCKLLALIQSRFVKVVKKWLKHLKSLFQAIDKSSSLDRQLIINNISRIILNGYDTNTLTTP